MLQRHLVLGFYCKVHPRLLNSLVEMADPGRLAIVVGQRLVLFFLFHSYILLAPPLSLIKVVQL